MSTELKLSKLERIILTNQLKILEALYPDEATQLSVQREGLERGYELLYGLDFEYIYDGDDVMAPDESREVWDTMDGVLPGPRQKIGDGSLRCRLFVAHGIPSPSA